MSSPTRVGFVGLGNMGAPMARNLAAAGFSLTLRDVDPSRAQALAAELGAARARAPEDFADCEIVVTMLPTGAEVRAVLLDWDGGLVHALAAGTIVIDMSSSDAVGTRALRARLAEHGLALIDAPVSGGVAGARAATLAIMTGGDDGPLEHLAPMLAALGRAPVRVGGLGAGHAARALNNHVAAACFTASCEALLVGTRFGLEPATVFEAINGSTGRNFNTEHTIGAQVLSRDFATGFALRLMAKDIGLAAALAEATATDAPTCALMARLWSEALEAEGGDVDFTAAVRHWEKANATELH